jgi:hypothetical protein
MLQTGQAQNWSKSSLTPELAATELIKRLDATEQLMEFTRYTFRKYQVNSHHKTIASQLERVRGRQPYLFVRKILYVILVN